MKLAVIVAAAMLGIALTAGQALACAACGGKGNAMHFHGTVAKVDGAKVTVKATDNSTFAGKEIVVETDAKTAVMVDDKAARVEDLKAGMPCSVSPASGTAVKIMAKAAPAAT